MSVIEKTTSYFVRPMRAEDIPQVTIIDREAFPTDWPPTAFKKEMNNKLAHYLVVVNQDGSCQDVSNTPAKPAAGQESNGSLLARLKKFLNIGAQENGNSAPSLDHKIVGYAGFWLMADEVHITDIAVPDSCRGLGLGELLIISIINSALEMNALVVTLEVRVSNTVAQSMYKKYGFQNVGLRRGYYSDNNEDAILMTSPGLSSDPYQPLFQQLKSKYAERWGANRYPYI